MFSTPVNDSIIQLKMPSELPLIVLSDCYHFPATFLPLFIFEERYRSMLSHALKSDRMFGVGIRSHADTDRILPVTTVGLISACVTQPDGTSHLILQGLRRARITGFNQDKPFRIACIEPMKCEPADPLELALLRDKAVAAIPPCPSGAEPAMRQLKDQLIAQGDPETLCDILTYHFVRSSESLRDSLQETCLIRRYNLLLDALTEHGTKTL